jgi:hypothetical protein
MSSFAAFALLVVRSDRENMDGMTKQKFEFLCRRVLVPEMNKAMRRHMTSRNLLRETVAAFDNRLSELTADLGNQAAATNRRLDNIASLLRK